MTVHLTKAIGAFTTATVRRGRQFASTDVLERADLLNNILCPARNFGEFTGKSGHLQRYTVVYTVALLVALENSFKQRPRIDIEPATAQNGQGTRSNPYAHSVPCGIRLNGVSMQKHFVSLRAAKEAMRCFGLGVKADEEHWQEDVEPAVLNVADRVLEKHHSQIGLCEAYRRTLDEAASRMGWQGTGFQPPPAERAVALIKEIDLLVWLPRMKAAYEDEIVRQKERLGRLDPSAPKYAKVQARIQVLEGKLASARDAVVDYGFIVDRVFDAMAEERAARAIE